jgi:hypothetical protein
MSHLPSVPPGRLMFVTGIAILLCFVAFSGCTQPVIPSPGPVSTTPPVVTTGASVPPVTTGQVVTKGPDYLTYTNSQYGFSLSYPSGWTVQENTGGSVVTFQAPSEGRDDLYRENLKVTVEDLSSSPMSLEQYKSAQMTKKQALDSFNLIYDQPYRVSGFNGWKIAYTANSGMLMEWVEIFTVKGTTAYDITFSAQESSYANYVVAMDTMTKSFQLTN